MAITVDAVSVSANVTNTSVTWQHTCAADANILVVAVQTVDSEEAERTV